MAKLKKANILIVDDIENNLIALEHALDDLPAKIYKAKSGEEALRLIIGIEFALVLLDVQMPGMDGFETAELMRKNRYTETVPIIFVTAISKEKVHVFKGYQSGAVDYLFKPIDEHVLRSKVQIFLNLYYQKTQRLTGILSDLQQTKTELERRNQELSLLATHDVLTDLPNRRQLEDDLNRCLSSAKRYKTKFAVLFFDVDNFKVINDSYGHTIGDAVLKSVSAKALSCIRQEDFLARLGGDEFAVILTYLRNYDNAGRFAEQMKKLFNEPQDIEGIEVNVSLSIGIACYPLAGKTTEGLLRNADIAMYRAKAEGKNNYQYYTQQLNEEYTHRATIEKSLQQALSNNAFHMVYQTVYELKTLRPAGVEALIRWDDPDLGSVSPAEFIPIAEEIGLIESIGEWIIKTSCEQFAKWYESGLTDMMCAINLSPRQLQQPELLATTRKVLETLSIPPEIITLELTETAIMQNVTDAEALLKAFQDMGIRISIDDFGTGYSSLSRLRQMPIYALKIDQSFVRDVVSDKNDTIIVQAILTLANSLDLETIGEGIESKQQLDFLIEHGCRYGQGFYLSKPLLPEEVTKIFNKDR
jgi:diguanylate cyclase (GGDEF)-like protein